MARIGGDEFLMIGISDPDDGALLERAERLRRALTRPISFHGRLCQVGATVGIGTWAPGAGPADRVVADADIDCVVRKGSLELLRDLMAVHGGRPRVSVNISSAQLSDASIVEQIEWQVDGFGLSPDQVRIEILESTLLDDRSSQIAENIRAFAARGYPVELDDYSTGHAAITSLRQFPVSRIKIDRSLVNGIDRDESSLMITDTIVTLASRLGLEVLAEGVETAEELAILRQIGCSAVQGHQLARPMSRAALIDWLTARTAQDPHEADAAP